MMFSHGGMAFVHVMNTNVEPVAVNLLHALQMPNPETKVNLFNCTCMCLLHYTSPAKHDTSPRCIPHQFPMDESLSDKCGYNKHSGKQHSL